MKKTITVAGLALLVVICILPSTVLAQGQGQQWVGTWTGGASLARLSIVDSHPSFLMASLIRQSATLFTPVLAEAEFGVD